MQKRFFRLNLWIAYVVLLIVGVFYACYDEDSGMGTSKERDAIMAEARILYSKTVDNAVQVYTRSKTPSMLIKPEWKWVTIEKSADYVALEIGKLSEHGFFYVDPAAAEKTKKTGKSDYSQSKTSFVFLKNRKKEESCMFLMTISPTLEYIENTNFKPFRKMSYLKRDKSFSGLIFYHNLQGEFVNGWRYKDGIIISEIALTDMDKQDFVLTRSGGTCPNGYILYQVEKCYYTYAPYLGEITHVDCKYWYEIDVIYYDCPIGYIGSSGGGGGYGGGSSEGIGSNACQIGITACNSLDKADVESLDRIIDETLDDCAFQVIHDELYAENIAFTDIKYKENAAGNFVGGYNPINGVYYVKDNSTLNSFPEEYIHLYQRYVHNLIDRRNMEDYLGKTGHINFEFEAKLLQDLICFYSLKGCPSLGSSPDSKYSEAYSKWIDQLTWDPINQTYRYPSINELLNGYKDINSNIQISYWEFMEEFGKHNSAYNYPIDYNITPLAIDKIVSQLTYGNNYSTGCQK